MGESSLKQKRRGMFAERSIRPGLERVLPGQ